MRFEHRKKDEKLDDLKDRNDVVVIALPRADVPIASEVDARLECDKEMQIIPRPSLSGSGNDGRRIGGPLV